MLKILKAYSRKIRNFLESEPSASDYQIGRMLNVALKKEPFSYWQLREILKVFEADSRYSNFTMEEREAMLEVANSFENKLCFSTSTGDRANSVVSLFFAIEISQVFKKRDNLESLIEIVVSDNNHFKGGGVCLESIGVTYLKPYLLALKDILKMVGKYQQNRLSNFIAECDLLLKGQGAHNIQQLNHFKKKLRIKYGIDSVDKISEKLVDKSTDVLISQVDEVVGRLAEEFCNDLDVAIKDLAQRLKKYLAKNLTAEVCDFIVTDLGNQMEGKDFLDKAEIIMNSVVNYSSRSSSGEIYSLHISWPGYLKSMLKSQMNPLIYELALLVDRLYGVTSEQTSRKWVDFMEHERQYTELHIAKESLSSIQSFFAAASEYYFRNSKELKIQAPDLFDALKDVYGYIPLPLSPFNSESFKRLSKLTI